MNTTTVQDKEKEVSFFDQFAQENEHYDVFTEASTARLIQTCVQAGGWKDGAKIADLGCGSGIFTQALADLGFSVTGVDLSPGLIDVARQRFPDVEFLVGDVENLPFDDGAFDGILLSGILHHLPDPKPCAREVHRVLQHDGTFSAFDPNRRNPFMWLYRDKSSPLYSSKGVTENERPVLAEQLTDIFDAAGFETASSYLSDLRYQYVESAFARYFLPVYNTIDRLLFKPTFMERYRAFVITTGRKI